MDLHRLSLARADFRQPVTASTRPKRQHGDKRSSAGKASSEARFCPRCLHAPSFARSKWRGYGIPHLRYDAGPVAERRLPEEPRSRIPRAVGAARSHRQSEEKQRHPHRLPGARQMRDRGVDRDDRGRARRSSRRCRRSPPGDRRGTSPPWRIRAAVRRPRAILSAAPRSAGSRISVSGSRRRSRISAGDLDAPGFAHISPIRGRPMAPSPGAIWRRGRAARRRRVFRPGWIRGRAERQRQGRQRTKAVVGRDRVALGAKHRDARQSREQAPAPLHRRDDPGPLPATCGT